ncbi:unknown [Sutterella sp. CAG:351]|nr:unknown [Sutterella sp. CAG:351]
MGRESEESLKHRLLLPEKPVFHAIFRPETR